MYRCRMKKETLPGDKMLANLPDRKTFLNDYRGHGEKTGRIITQERSTAAQFPGPKSLYFKRYPIAFLLQSDRLPLCELGALGGYPVKLLRAAN